jgi:hypothetical protein
MKPNDRDVDAGAVQAAVTSRGGARRRWLRARFLVPAIAVGLIAGYALATYPRFRSEMRETKEELTSGSRLIKTSAGRIEYGEAGAGHPVLVLHGAGGG